MSLALRNVAGVPKAVNTTGCLLELAVGDGGACLEGAKGDLVAGGFEVVPGVLGNGGGGTVVVLAVDQKDTHVAGLVEDVALEPGRLVGGQAEGDRVRGLGDRHQEAGVGDAVRHPAEGLRRAHGIRNQDAKAFLKLLLVRGEQVDPTREIRRCRDPKDDKLLELAVSGRADVLVSGDGDLQRSTVRSEPKWMP